VALVRDTNHLRAFMALVVVAALLDASVLVDSSVAQGRHGIAQGAQPNGVNTIVQVTAPLGNWTLASGPYPANLSTRGEITAFILTNPGVYMREVSEELGIPMGTVQYHTWMLAKNGEVEECRTGKYRRFFGAGRYTETERKVISLLRQGTAGKIVTLLSEEQPLAHMKLAEVLGLSSQALTWHMKRLESMGMVETGVFPGQLTRSYRLVDGVVQKVRSASHPPPNLVQVPAIL
jgi:DNA-binding transcriptional ArsR family regulator